MRRFFFFGTLLLSLREQDAAKLEHAPAVNLERAAKLPSFVMDEKAIRYKSRHTDPPKWEVFDTIESEIAACGPRTERILINDPGGYAIRYDEEASEYPIGFWADPWKQTTTWVYVTIGDVDHLSPIRNFEASTNITFK